MIYDSDVKDTVTETCFLFFAVRAPFRFFREPLMSDTRNVPFDHHAKMSASITLSYFSHSAGVYREPARRRAATESMREERIAFIFSAMRPQQSEAELLCHL